MGFGILMAALAKAKERGMGSDGQRDELGGRGVREAELRQVVGPLEQVMARRIKRRKEGCAYIFHSNGKPFSQPHGGLRVWCYREWRCACEKAKLPSELRIYDLRRSAIRNLIHAGVPQATVMKISGHRTADTFRRYMIDDPEDTANAFRRVASYVRQRKKRQKRQATPAPDTDKTRTGEPESSESLGKNGSSGRI